MDFDAVDRVICFARATECQFLKPSLTLEIEELAEKRVLLFLLRLPPPRIMTLRFSPLRGLPGSGRSGQLDNLVQFATIEPNAAALRAIVDLDTVAIGHYERLIFEGAFHMRSPKRTSLRPLLT